MTRYVLLALSLALVLVAAPQAFRSAEVAEALPPKNLKFYPKDMSKPKLYKEMKVLCRDLGVKCAHCHVMMPRKQFASEKKPVKEVARKMLFLTRENNEDLKKIFGKKKFDEVTCYTCHRGKKSPETEPMVLDDSGPDPEKKFKHECDEHPKLTKQMEEFTKKLNKRFKELFPKNKKAKVTCYTCHRGVGHPKSAPDED